MSEEENQGVEKNIKTVKTKLNLDKKEEKRLDKAARQVNYAYNESIRFVHEFSRGSKNSILKSKYYTTDKNGKRVLKDYKKREKNEAGEWVETDKKDNLAGKITVPMQRKDGLDEVEIFYDPFTGYMGAYSIQKFLAGSLVCGLDCLPSSTLDLVAVSLDTAIKNMKKKRIDEIVGKKKRTQYSTLPKFKSNIPALTNPWIPFKITAKNATTELLNNRIIKTGLGNFKIYEDLTKNHAIENITNGTFTKESDGWYVTITYKEIVSKGRVIAPKQTTQVVGVDIGLKTTAVAATDSHLMMELNLPNTEKTIKKFGKVYESEADLRAELQRIKARKIEHAKKNGARGYRAAVKGSKTIQKLEEEIKKSYAREKRKVDIDLHTAAYKITELSDTVVIGDVSAKFLQKTGGEKYRSRPIGRFKNICAKIGQKTGTTVLEINESKTTVTCSGCGAESGPSGAEGLKIRQWTCSVCGANHGRDENSAKNIAIKYQKNRNSAKVIESN